MTAIMRVLDLARWAPSGDNTQPWEFVVAAENRVLVLARDTRDHCVYDLDGHASQISVGALLQNIEFAATRFGMLAQWARRPDTTDERPTFEIAFERAPDIAENPLVAQIERRCVQRRPLSTKPLSATHKAVLQSALGPHFGVRWFEKVDERWRMALLNFRSARIRLTVPEAYAVHSTVIEWDAEQSVDRIPDAALGASRNTLHLMRWVMSSWRRVEFFNRFFAGTLAPRIELELIPGMACGAHAVLFARRPPASIDDYIDAGRALQRFWLAASAAGLQFQPAYTPLVFARYARDGVRFTARATALSQARDINLGIEQLLGHDVAARAVFMGRIGYGRPAQARSIRLPLAELIRQQSSTEHALPAAEHQIH